MMLRLRIFLCAGLLACCAGCGSKDDFYRLNAMPAAATGNGSDLSVVVGPISLPGYIDRPELVFQRGANEFALPTHARWIGSLQENIGRVLASDLGQVIRSSRVRSSADPVASAQYRVALEVRQFHGISGQDALLDASWKIQSGSGAVLSRHSGVFHEPIIGDGYEPLVAAESRLLAQCASAIGRSLGR